MRGTLAANLKSLPRPFWILFAGTFINRFGSFVVPFLVLYLTSRGHPMTKAGLAISAYGVGHLVAGGLGGYLADRIGRRKTIALSMFSGAAMMMALAAARDLATITLLTGFLGLTSELYRPASIALIADLVPAGQRTAAYAAYRLAINAGFAFGPATAGFLAQRSFLWLFIGDALTSALYGVIALMWLPQGVKNTETQSRGREGWSEVWRNRPFLFFLCSFAPVTLVFFQLTSTFPLHIRDLGLSSTTFGLLLSLNGLVIVFCELPLTALTQRWPPRRVIAVGYFFTGLGAALTGFAHHAWALAGTVLVWTLGEMISAPVQTAFVADMAPAHSRGRYMGLFSLTWSLGLMCGPALGTAVYARNPMQLWAACGALGIVSAVLVLIHPNSRLRAG